MFIWLREYGKLEYDDTTRRELINEWDEATMAKVGMKFTPSAIWEWLEYVETLGDKLGRSLSQRRKKLLDGFPESFDVITSPERLKPDPGTYVLPATYPDHHPKKGDPNPNAGKPDLYELCKAFYPEWHHRIKTGQIKSVPRGSVYKVDHNNDSSCEDDDRYEDDDDSDNDVVYAAATRKQITSRSVCTVCGGRGHFGRVEGMDCLTKQLGINIPKSELAQTQYPSGITYPSFNSRNSSMTPSHKSSHGAHLAASTRRQGKLKQAKHNPKSVKPPSRPKPKRVSQVNEHDSENVEHEEYTEQDDDQVSDDDPHVDFATFAVNYHTIDTRYNTHHSYSDESSDDESSTSCRQTPRERSFGRETSLDECRLINYLLILRYRTKY